MNGRVVELQRHAPAGQWVRVRQARFRPSPRVSAFEAVVDVRTRGLTLRAYVPARSITTPCVTAGASRTWRS